MSNAGTRLDKELTDVRFSLSAMEAIAELSYTAYESGLVDYQIRDDVEGDNLVRLVLLGLKYQGIGVPECLKL